MTRYALLPLLYLAISPSFAQSGDGMIRKESPHSVEETAERFEAAIRAKGLKVFPRFDHAAAAKEYGLQMNPTVVVSFGNPKYGTPFMIKTPTAGVDFPPKAVVYRDDSGKTWLAYNSSDYLYRTIFKRHDIKYPEEHVAWYAGVLDELSNAAIAKK